MQMNYLTILICAVTAMVIGFIWYGPLFGKIWRQMMEGDTKSIEQNEAIKKSMWIAYLAQLILSIITAWTLLYFISNWTNFTASFVGIAVCAWFGFVMTTNASAALWSGRPKKIAWKIFSISSGAQFVTFIVFGLIIGWLI